MKDKTKEKECAICGKVFIGPGICCSNMCKELNKGINPYIRTQNKPVKPQLGIEEMALIAMEKGETYGEYISKQRMKEIKIR